METPASLAQSKAAAPQPAGFSWSGTRGAPRPLQQLAAHNMSALGESTQPESRKILWGEERYSASASGASPFGQNRTDRAHLERFRADWAAHAPASARVKVAPT